MDSTEFSNPATPTDSWRRADTLAAIALFPLTAIVVVWQNLRLGVLWDLSYILENAHRISLGDVPYKDFPFPYAPITFLIQAAIIKLTGHLFFHHIIYAALAGGAGTLLTWRILLNVLRGKVTNHRLIAFLLSTPLTVLGIYSIYPHPFYDPDCTLAILCGILLLQRLEIRGFTPTRAFCCGAVLLLPLFVKQNTGLGFLFCIGASLVVLTALNLRRGKSISGFLYIFAGILATFLSALALIHHFAGLHNYWNWTIQFASERRTPQIADMLQPFQNYNLLIWLATAIVGIFLAQIASKRAHKQNFILTLTSILLISAPFIWSIIYLFLDDDPSSRAERLLALWPFLLIISFAIGFLRARREQGINLILPFVVIGTILGAFLSQQLWGSTYAIWPLLIILIAILISELAPHFQHAQWSTPSLAAVIAICLIVSGAFYVASRERLSYANVWEGEITRSNLPALKGLSVRGPWIPQFEELVRYSENEIPKGDGLLMIPGEDLFYYTTGRHPRFPVLMFDHTVNPYSPLRVQAVAKSANINWLVVKRNLQIQGTPYEDEAALLQLLLGDFQLVQHLENYDVYIRK
ncbi:MAG TPA: hypothetical protein VIH72_08515 [Candidatus Acidoferrales bacterium]